MGHSSGSKGQSLANTTLSAPKKSKPQRKAELERLEGINEDILRQMTIRVEAHEEGPSAMMRKRDEGDREDRGDRGDRRGPRPDRPRRRDESAFEGGIA